MDEKNYKTKKLKEKRYVGMERKQIEEQVLKYKGLK